MSAVFWYVDNQATGTNAGTSWTNAWPSISAVVWASVNPGDTVFISGGSTSKTYTESNQFTVNGTIGSPITIDSGANSPSPTGHNGTVIIDGSSGYCMRTDGNYNYIKNLTCQNATSSGFRIQGTGTILEGNIINTSYQQGIDIHFCNGCIARGNIVTTSDDVAQQTDGITVYDSSDAIVEKNWIKITNQNNCTNCHNDGIQASFATGSVYTNLTIRYNYVENVKASSANAQGIYVTQIQGDLKIYGNVVNVPIGGQAVASKLINSLPVNVYAVGNIIKSGGYWGLRIEDDNPVVKNNIIWQTGGNVGYILNGALIRLDGLSGNDSTNVDYNQYFAPYSNSSTFSFYYGSSSKSWNTWRGTYSFDSHSTTALESTLDSCLRPATNSLSPINSGITLADEYKYGLNWSLCGTSSSSAFLPVNLVDRTLGGASWDMGPYEYVVPVTVTVNQAEGQSDPTNTSPVNYTVLFSESVTDFTNGDVTLSGTAGATTVTVTGSGTTYNMAVSGMTGSGTVMASILAGKVTGLGGTNVDSTSSDNTVNYDISGPTLTSIAIGDSAGFTVNPTSVIDIVSSNTPVEMTFSCNGGTNWSNWIAYSNSV